MHFTECLDQHCKLLANDSQTVSYNHGQNVPIMWDLWRERRVTSEILCSILVKQGPRDSQHVFLGSTSSRDADPNLLLASEGALLPRWVGLISFSRCVASHRPSPQPTEMSSLRRVSANCDFFSLSDAPHSSSFAKCEQSLPSSDRQGAHSVWKSGFFSVNCKRQGKGGDHSASKTLILNTLGLHLEQVFRCLFVCLFLGR